MVTPNWGPLAIVFTATLTHKKTEPLAAISHSAIGAVSAFLDGSAEVNVRQELWSSGIFFAASDGRLSSDSEHRSGEIFFEFTPLCDFCPYGSTGRTMRIN
jgi:hypothetical protein